MWNVHNNSAQYEACLRDLSLSLGSHRTLHESPISIVHQHYSPICECVTSTVTLTFVGLSILRSVNEVRVWVSECVSGWTDEWVSELVSEWTCEWVNGGVSEWVWERDASQKGAVPLLLILLQPLLVVLVQLVPLVPLLLHLPDLGLVESLGRRDSGSIQRGSMLITNMFYGPSH